MRELATFDELRRFVRDVLAARGDVDRQVPLLESILKKRGQPCGVEFTLLVGRTARLSAIWDAERERVFFYDQELCRFQVSAVRGLGPEAFADVDSAAVATCSAWRGK